VTEDEQNVLRFAAEHEAILTDHIDALLAVPVGSARQQIDQLSGQGLIHRPPAHHGQAGPVQITARGLAAINSPLPVPRFETIRDLRTTLALPWLTLLARNGITFGPVKRAVTQRVMRHQDVAARAGQPLCPTAPEHHRPPYGVPLSTGIDHTVARHYPDLMLLVSSGHRVAMEVHARRPASGRLTAQMTAYQADPQIDAVVYFTNDPPTADTIRGIRAQLGVESLVRVQGFEFGPETPITDAQ
jgi:hypothetical protein